MTYVISTDASLSRLWPITRHAALVMSLGAPQSISVPKIHPKNSCFGNKWKNMAPTVTYLNAQSLRSSKNEAIQSYICASRTSSQSQKKSPPAVRPHAIPCLLPRKKIKRGPRWWGGSILDLNFRNCWRKEHILLPKVFSQLPKLSFWDFIF